MSNTAFVQKTFLDSLRKCIRLHRNKITDEIVPMIKIVSTSQKMALSRKNMTLGDHLSLLDIMGAELIKNMIHIMHKKARKM